MLLPCAKNVCPACAADHPPDKPHNSESLYYQYSFFERFGRWPTWADAVAHCPKAMREFVRDFLVKRERWTEPEGEPIAIRAGVVDGVGVDLSTEKVS
jgi:hypothetical protein